MDTCSICFEKRHREQFVKTDCGCVACSDCHLQWARSQLDSKARVVLRCPMPQCMAPLTTTDILRTLDEDTQEQLEETQTWNLLRSSTDVKACPVCNYVGFISPKQRSYLCEPCNKCWQEPATPWFSPLRSVSALALELMSQSWKRLFCKQCPSCAAFIQKNEGCKHMECFKCGYEFCWKCYIDWKSHMERTCSGTVYGLLETIVCVLIVLFIVKLLWMYPAASWFLWLACFYLVLLSGIALNAFLCWLVLDMFLEYFLVKCVHSRTNTRYYASDSPVKLFTALAVQVPAQWLVLLLAKGSGWCLLSVLGSYGVVVGCLMGEVVKELRG